MAGLEPATGGPIGAAHGGCFGSVRIVCASRARGLELGQQSALPPPPSSLQSAATKSKRPAAIYLPAQFSKTSPPFPVLLLHRSLNPCPQELHHMCRKCEQPYAPVGGDECRAPSDHLLQGRAARERESTSLRTIGDPLPPPASLVPTQLRISLRRGDGGARQSPHERESEEGEESESRYVC